MEIKIEVKPADKTFVGWDANVISWKDNFTKLTIHKISWAEETHGVFVGSTGDLAPGLYGIRVELFGAGREVDLTVRGKPKITEPGDGTWPMNVKVDGARQTQNSDTWYFEVAK